MYGLIAIVGRPNVGKSALFNRIVGKRIAIVHDEPGVTRDRISAEAEWDGQPFTLVDTGGIGLLRGEKAREVLVQAAFVQVQLAIDSAAVIIMVVDAKEGLVPLDHEVASRLRASGKLVLVAVNKVDNPQSEPAALEYAELGFEKVFPVSAIHGHGIRPLMDAAVELLPPQAAEPRASVAVGTTEISADHARPVGPLKLAIVGRPNVGKSSIVNALTQSDRVLVTPIPGTTRDSVDVPFEVETGGVRESYMLIDTAGLRKKRRVDNSIEFFSVKRAEASVRRCDIVVFVLDAETGILEQDKKIGDLIVDERKPCIIAVNKWDAVGLSKTSRRKTAAQKDSRARGRSTQPQSSLAEFGKWVQEKLFFLDYAPVIFTSAKSGFHLDRLLEAVRYVAAQLQQSIPTALLNRVLYEAIERRQPISAAGHFLKFFYATQVQTVPPTFLLFVNRSELFSGSYAKYLSNGLRKAFGYEGCPILLRARARPKTIQSKRKSR